MGSIADRLDEPDAESWRPEPGGSLVGRVTEISQRTTEWGTYPVVTVRSEGDGLRRTFHAFHSVAKDLIVGNEVAVGDEIGVRYVGKVDGAKFGYESYKLVVEHNGGWSPFSAQLQPGEPPAPTEHSLASRGDDIPF